MTPDRLYLYAWEAFLAQPAIRARFWVHTAASLLLLSSPFLLVAQLSPQDAELVAKRVQEIQRDQIVLSVPMAGLIVTIFGGVISIVSAVIIAHVNGKMTVARANIMAEAAAAIEASVTDCRTELTEALDRRDEDSERFRLQQEDADRQRERAMMSEMQTACMDKVNGKYITRAEIQSLLARAEERYTQTQQLLGKIDERISKHGHDLNNLTSLMEAVKLRLPKSVG